MRCCNTRVVLIHLNFLLICLYSSCTTVVLMGGVSWRKSKLLFSNLGRYQLESACLLFKIIKTGVQKGNGIDLAAC